MPLTLLPPQIFTVFQQPDSASPAVRLLSEQNTYLIGVRPGCTNPLPCQRRLGGVNEQKHYKNINTTL